MKILFEDFSAKSGDDWKARLEKDLKGLTFENLQSIDRNGLSINPFYTANDISPNSDPVFSHTDWVICAAINAQNEPFANKIALNELANGASGLCFECEVLPDFKILLAGIELQHIYTRFVLNTKIEGFVDSFQAYLSEVDLDLSSVNVSIVDDCIARFLNSGYGSEMEAQQTFFKNVSLLQAVNVDCTIFQNAGANTQTQLACAASQINEYIHWASLSNQLKEIQKINISYTVATDFFEEIAKLRALRIIVTNILEQYHINPKITLHIVTSDTYRSAADAYSNLLRDTIAGMAGVLGGCNSMLLHRFDAQKNAEATEFSRRMARNQQLIFKEESYLSQIADAAAGSFYIEHLTKQLAEAAWNRFQNIEIQGGIIAYFESGELKRIVAQQAQQWIEEYQSGKRVLIGVNKYVNEQDKAVHNIVAKGDTIGLQKINLAANI